MIIIAFYSAIRNVAVVKERAVRLKTERRSIDPLTLLYNLFTLKS